MEICRQHIMRLILALVVVMLVVSCGTKNNGNVPFTNDEFNIYSLVIDSLYYQKEIKGASKQNELKYLAHNYVLIDSTNGDTADNRAEKLASNGIASELINDFEAANTKRYSLDEYSKRVSSIKLISLDKYKSYYTKTRHINDGGMSGFIEFSKDYPHSYGTSVFQITRAGFSSDKKYAVVGTMHLRGINMGYDYSYLEKEGEKWIIKKIINH